MKKLSILLLSWRDIKNPKKGGAEVFDFEILSRLAKKGHKITWFAPLFEGAPEKEEVEGITIERKGTFFSIHDEAIKYYQKHKDSFDLVLDELHGYPFFTSLYIEKPKATIIHEVAGEIWFSMFSLPIAIMGYFFEKLYFQFLKKQMFVCPSPSTQKDLIQLGVTQKNIYIAKEGSNAKRVSKLENNKRIAQFCFMGGIRKMKGIPLLIDSFARVVSRRPDARLYLVGKVDPQYETELFDHIQRNNLKDNVIVTGYVSAEERDRIMKESQYLLSCSVKEGFGLIVVEANALGTPAITFDVHGYRDIIINGETGILVEKRSADNFSEAILSAITLPTYEKMREKAWNYSYQFNWDDSSDHFEEILNSISEKDKQVPSPAAKLFVSLLLKMTRVAGNLATALKVAN